MNDCYVELVWLYLHSCPNLPFYVSKLIGHENEVFCETALIDFLLHIWIGEHEL